MQFDQVIKHKFTSDRGKAIAHLLFTSKLLLSKIGEDLASIDLTFQQFNILSIVEGQKGGDACVNTIKERMFDRNSNVSRLLNKMVSKGWLIKKRCSEDQRVVYLHITDEGKDVRRQGRSIMSKVFDHFDVLSDSEYVELDRLLHKFDELFI